MQDVQAQGEWILQPAGNDQKMRRLLNSYVKEGAAIGMDHSASGCLGFDGEATGKVPELMRRMKLSTRRAYIIPSMRQSTPLCRFKLLALASSGPEGII